MQVRLDGFGKECPRILQVGNRHHCENASHQLDPTIRNAGGVNQRVRRCSHSYDLHDSALHVNSALQEQRCSAELCQLTYYGCELANLLPSYLAQSGPYSILVQLSNHLREGS